MDFASITLFLVLSYLRPQEWISGISFLQPVKVCMGMAIISMVTRYRGFNVRDFFRSPHDWWMFGFVLWMVVSAHNPFATLGSVYSFFLFYVVTVQALARIRRIETFLNWWAAMILVVAILAIASEYGFDPMHSYDVSHGRMKGRLALNLSIFNNPNALGHAVYPGMLLLYFALIWQRPVFMKIVAIPVIAIPIYCIFLTMSKGAFVCGFATLVIALAFGRPKVVQLLILLGALTVGWAGIQALPRMEELDNSKKDQAIQGRVAASKWGLKTMSERPTGVGYGNFGWGFFAAHGYHKSSHSSFVQYGAELGLPGLFLFFGITYSCLRTLLLATTRNSAEERARRMLFVLLLSYLVSSWMVDFGYRGTFFLMCGTIAALHRLLMQEQQPEEQPAREPQFTPAFAFARMEPRLVPAGASPALVCQTSLHPLTPAAPAIDIEAETKPLTPGDRWNSFRWADFAIVIAMTFAAIQFWRYIIHKM